MTLDHVLPFAHHRLDFWHFKWLADMLGSVWHFPKFVQFSSRGGLLLRSGDWAERVIPALPAASEHLVARPRRRGSLVEHLLVDCELFIIFEATTGSTVLVLVQNVCCIDGGR